MDLAQLEHFLAVVDEGSFTRAAERMRRTQPAISQSIKKLEETIGAPLFARDLHDVSLTDAGKVLVDHARRLVRSRDDAMREVRALKDLQTGTLTIAAHESAAVYLLPDPLRTYLTRFPHIKVGIHRSRLTDIPRQVMDREVHLGFVKEEPRGHHGLQSIEVHRDAMILIAPPGHPLTNRDAVRIADLGQERLIVHHQCTSTEQNVISLFERHATRCNIVAELWSFENIKSFVQAGVGVAIVPRITVQRELRDRSIEAVPVVELDTPRRTLMVYRDGAYLSDAARELIAMVKAFRWPSERVAPVPLKRRA